jgi:biotin carboxyl carrier protein
MKKYRVQVNGKAYEVDVEEIGTATLSLVHSQPSKSEPIPAAIQVQPAAAPSQPSKPAPELEDEVIACPMPGKIVAIEVKPGQAVKDGDVIVVLEAMKMENEIVCGRAGKVKEIAVSENASVNTGDILAIIG